MRAFGLLAAAYLLGACASMTPQGTAVVSATPYGVSIRFLEGDLQRATLRAQELCANHQRNAQLQTVTPGDGRERIAAFLCT